MNWPSQSQIAQFFQNLAVDAGFIDRLKIRYRPYICPFLPLLKYTEGHASLFDVGCGSGQFCLLASRFSGVNRIHGIEIDPRRVANAYNGLRSDERRGVNVVFDVYDGTTLPRVIEECDVVFMIDVLHHIPSVRQRAFLRQLHDRMRPGATLVLKDIDAASPFVVFNKLHDAVFSGSAGHELSDVAAREACESLGFEVQEAVSQRVGVYAHCFLEMRKAPQATEDKVSENCLSRFAGEQDRRQP